MFPAMAPENVSVLRRLCRMHVCSNGPDRLALTDDAGSPAHLPLDIALSTIRRPLMPVQRCPKCTNPGRLLEHSSTDADVYYYRCDACGHVWSHTKANPGGPARSVTKTPQPERD